jgi:peroxiredoxin
MGIPFFRWVVLCLAVGCQRSEPAVPHYDVAGKSYGPMVFKDVAPANAKVAEKDFPLTFVDSEGRSVDLTVYRGKKKVVLVVLRGMARSERGGFCPSCLAQAGSLTKNASAFAERNAEVLVVFPGPAEQVGEFIQRVKSADRLPHMLLDKECTVCDRLGIRDDLAKPSTYILDTHGRVVYAYVGETSTDRPSVKAILAQLDQTE